MKFQTSQKYILYFLFILGSLTSCTLSMEEYVVPEEERGRDEVYTVENEYGSLSYQFADSVLYVTENIQDQYLVRTEADSILYFSDNIPSQWRPYIGMKMAASLSRALPKGLNNRVLAVENIGGIYKVTTTPIPADEVYENLSYCFDAAVPIPDLDVLTEEELLDYGYELMIDPETGDSVLMDWNDYEVAKGIRPANAKRCSLKRYRTRGDDEIEEGKLDENGYAVSELLDLKIDSRTIMEYKGAIGAIIDLLKGDIFDAAEKMREDAAGSKIDWSPYMGIKLNVKEYKKVHVEEDKQKKYELKYTDSYSIWDVGWEAGIEVKGNFEYSKNAKWTGYGNADDMFDKMKKANSLFGSAVNKVKPNVKTAKSWNKLRVRIPICFIGPMPVAIIVGASLKPTIEVNGHVAGSVTYKTPTIRSGEETKNGHTDEFCDTIAPGQVTHVSVAGNASVKIGAAIRVYAGFEFGGTVGFTVGGNFEAYAEGEMGINFIDVGEKMTAFSGGHGSLVWYGNLYADFSFSIAPLGIEVFDKEILKTDNMELWKVEQTFGPEVDGCFSSASFGYLMGDDYDDDEGLIYGHFYTGDFKAALDPILKLHTYYPGMKIYFGPVSDNIWTYMQPLGEGSDYGNDPVADMGDWKPVDSNKRYHFLWRGKIDNIAKEYNKEKIDEVHMIPVFYYYNPHFNPNDKWFYEAEKEIVENEQIIMINDQSWQDVAKPYIYTLSTAHIESLDMGMCDKGQLLGQGGDNNWDMAKHVQKYTFYTTVDVMGGSRMKEWGLDLKIYDPYKKRIKNSHRTIKVDKLRSGTYTFVFTFDSDWEGNKSLKDEDGKEVKNQLYYTVRPYWNDPRASNAIIYADDKQSTEKHPIVYYKDDDDNIQNKILKDKTSFGEVDYKILNEAY